MSSFTKGPWRNKRGLIMSETRGCVAETEWRHTLVEDPREIEANGNLMAAAPDLLAVLKAVMPWASKAVADHYNQIAGQRVLDAAVEVIERVEDES